jgi:hypothetical protein
MGHFLRSLLPEFSYVVNRTSKSSHIGNMEFTGFLKVAYGKMTQSPWPAKERTEDSSETHTLSCNALALSIDLMAVESLP